MPTRQDLANAVRALAMDAVQQARSGHPGMPMGMADIAEVLWNDFLQHSPANPAWVNRDRFVLSNGHGSMLQYALLHLSGYALSIDDLKAFRQLHSKTPGHPELGYTPGVETTTGPLGQGLANGVGMALAEAAMAARFNRDGYPLIDHCTYVFLGDGCLMEGVSHEACSLAGTWGLGKLICFYDDNGISIDGEVQPWFSDDTPARFGAYDWQVIEGVDGHDPEQIRAAIEQARAESGRPTLICCRTVIGFGSPNKQGTAGAHGAPLGDDEIAATRERLGWNHGPFEIPDEVYTAWNAVDRGGKSEAQWDTMFSAYASVYPDQAAELKRRIAGDLPADFAANADAYIRRLQDEGASIASRKASQNALDAFGPLLPELIGGSADLAESNLTLWDGCAPFSADTPEGNYLHFGVREFGMTAIANGIALHGGVIPYTATFLIFMEYARNAVRLAALMKQRSILVYTHDSIGLGEDGPTHQPVEQIASLRMTPGMHLWRPCDTVETAVAWKAGLERADGPTALALSRQALPHQARSGEQVDAISRGAYVLLDSESVPSVILIATGSEIGIAVQAFHSLAEQGVSARVVSMPCAEVFLEQDAAWQEAVLPAAVSARIAVEAAHAGYWYRFVGTGGEIIGLERFGESAPGGQLLEEMGFSAAKVELAAKRVLGISG